jgi:hypothetical protein
VLAPFVLLTLLGGPVSAPAAKAAVRGGHDRPQIRLTPIGFIADNTDFGPAGANPLGRYTWDLQMLDQRGAGWQIEARFVVRR